MTDLPLAGSNAQIGVLICDDTVGLRELLRIVIELDPGLAVVGEAQDGREAIAQAKRHQPDVILLDISMPVFSGLQALPAIKTAAPNARVIAFTGLAASLVEKPVLSAGAHGFLQKGAHPDAIVDAIKHAYAAGREPLGRGLDPVVERPA